MDAVPKIEGHATFYTHLKAGRVEKAHMIGLENDRFVEKILFGRKYFEAPIITSRICGICPTIHNITATRAVEEACGIKVSEQTKKLRKLMLCGQMIQSHALHLYLLVLPDFFGLSSSFELQKNHPQLFSKAIKLKQFADKVLDVIGGRAVHPIASVPGGFKKVPSKENLKDLLKEIAPIKEIAKETITLFAGFQYPQVKREIIYSALSQDEEYAYYDGKIKTSAGDNFGANDYNQYFHEELKPYTRAKFATIRGKEVMVGAMARINLNYNSMPQEVIKIIEDHRPELLDNPFDNTFAQAVENYFFVLESERLLNELIKNGIDEKDPVKPPQKYSEGTGACEAPRGTLFHHYKLDKDGFIVECDIVTPTVQNLPAMELDMKNLGPILKELNEEERTKIIEMLIRAYDPCITCATH